MGRNVVYAAGILAGLLLLVPAVLEGAYLMALWLVPLPPAAPGRPLPPTAVTALWAAEGETGPPEIRPGSLAAVAWAHGRAAFVAWRHDEPMRAGRPPGLMPAQDCARVRLEGRVRTRHAERSLQHLTLAIWLTRHWRTEQILSCVAEGREFGRGALGAEAGAREWFGRDLAALGPAEAALLFGLLRSPAGYRPDLKPRAAFYRRNRVLAQMAANGALTTAELERLIVTPLGTVPPRVSGSSPDTGTGPCAPGPGCRPGRSGRRRSHW